MGRQHQDCLGARQRARPLREFAHPLGIVEQRRRAVRNEDNRHRALVGRIRLVSFHCVLVVGSRPAASRSPARHTEQRQQNLAASHRS